MKMTKEEKKLIQNLRIERNLYKKALHRLLYRAEHIKTGYEYDEEPFLLIDEIKEEVQDINNKLIDYKIYH